jgi:NAD(P)-dependent dehydrogenase (short-subunit alcohol dehydrogenase family)
LRSNHVSSLETLADRLYESPEFIGKRCLVTGAASGIGLEIANQLVSLGAHVLGVDIAAERLESVGRDLGESFVPVQADVADESAVAGAVAAAIDAFGGLDAAYNVAGAGRPASIFDHDLESWDFVVDLVQKGVFLSTKHEARAMAASGGGAIVNVSSLNAHVPMPLGSAYATAKAGVEMFSRNAALELASSGIRVNAVLPGLVATPATEPLFAVPGLREDFEQRIPLARAASAGEIAAPCLFLATEAARYITGASLVVDGGWEHSNYPDLRTYLG